MGCELCVYFKHCFELRAVVSFSETSALLQRLASAGQAMGKTCWSLFSEICWGHLFRVECKNQRGREGGKKEGKKGDDDSIKPFFIQSAA